MVKKEKLAKTEKKALKKARKKGKQAKEEVDRSDVKPTSPFST